MYYIVFSILICILYNFIVYIYIYNIHCITLYFLIQKCFLQWQVAATFSSAIFFPPILSNEKEKKLVFETRNFYDWRAHVYFDMCTPRAAINFSMSLVARFSPLVIHRRSRMSSWTNATRKTYTRLVPPHILLVILFALIVVLSKHTHSS